MADRDNQFFWETGRSTRVFLRIVLRVNIIICLARRRNGKKDFLKTTGLFMGLTHTRGGELSSLLLLLLLLLLQLLFYLCVT